MVQLVLALVAVACGVAAFLWSRSVKRLQRVTRRLEGQFGTDADPVVLARSAYRKELHTTVLYAVLALSSAVMSATDDVGAELMLVFVLLPVALTLVSAKDFAREARMAEERFTIERRAEEVLTQDQLAPQRWAARLAPDVLPDMTGFELGKVYKAGTGLMAGDFYDVFRVSPHRVAAVIGDVTGHGIEPSITALQAKYLLRVFLRQFRDPAQALEELNDRMSALESGDELISLCVAIFDTEAGTLRWASAGHPTVWLWHDREVQPLAATGPLLMLDPKGTFISREISLETGDLLLMYTDGLTEARDGDAFYGEERVATTIRRDPGVDVEVLCKSLLEGAKDFSRGPLGDDVAILAIRRL